MDKFLYSVPNTIGWVTVPKKRYIPSMSHPWRQASFQKHVDKQAHRTEQAS